MCVVCVCYSIKPIDLKMQKETNAKDQDPSRKKAERRKEEVKKGKQEGKGQHYPPS